MDVFEICFLWHGMSHTPFIYLSWETVNDPISQKIRKTHNQCIPVNVTHQTFTSSTTTAHQLFMNYGAQVLRSTSPLSDHQHTTTNVFDINRCICSSNRSCLWWSWPQSRFLLFFQPEFCGLRWAFNWWRKETWRIALYTWVVSNLNSRWHELIVS